MTDEELIESLRLWNRDAAADRIEALLREKAAAYAQGYGDCEAEISLTEIGRTNEFLHGQIAKWKARAERLEEALIWCSGSADFNEGGFAREGWLKLCAPLLKGADHD